MYIYIHMYVDMYVHIYVCICINIHVFICICVYIYIYVYVYIYAYKLTWYKYTCIHIYIYIYLSIYIYVYVYIYAYKLAWVHVCTNRDAQTMASIPPSTHPIVFVRALVRTWNSVLLCFSFFDSPLVLISQLILVFDWRPVMRGRGRQNCALIYFFEWGL